MPHSTFVFPTVILLLLNTFLFLTFSCSWRIKSAATRDHSLVQVEGATDKNGAWHKQLCYTFVLEYKRYLQTLGFTPLVLDNFAKK